jgi:hypothetical protein
MSIKFTTTEYDKDKSIKLLFEFLDHEVPEDILIDLKTALGKNRFIGSIQTNQVNGVYIEPIILKGTFQGTYVREGENITGARGSVNPSSPDIITAHERSLELGRLQGRVIKFFFDTIVMDVIVESYKRNYKNYTEIDYELVLQPHDFQEVTKPEGVIAMNENSVNLITGSEIKPSETKFDLTPEENDTMFNQPIVLEDFKFADKSPVKKIENFFVVNNTKGSNLANAVKKDKEKKGIVSVFQDGVLNLFSTSKTLEKKGINDVFYKEDYDKAIQDKSLIYPRDLVN